MKTKKKFLIILAIYLMAGISGCDKSDDPVQPEEQITFDGLEVLCDVLPSGVYTSIRFTSENIAYTVTNNGRIFKTEDGGYTWAQQESGTELYLNEIYFLDDFHGYIVGGQNEGVLLKTSDGGNTWDPTYFQEWLSSVHFINENTGFLIGKKFYTTKDGGITWDEVELGYFSYGSIGFFDEQTGFLSAGLLSTGFSLLKTTDGGTSWFILENISTSGEIQIKDNLAFMRSYSNIFITSDRGNTWQTTKCPTSGPVYFINERQAIGVGQHWYDLGFFPDGKLCISNDGGKHWEEKYFSSEIFYRIIDISFSNDSTAFAVGHSPQGCVIKWIIK